jgi:hypothetical protein
MPELGPSGSVRGAVSNHRPYRDHLQLCTRCEVSSQGQKKLHSHCTDSVFGFANILATSPN